MAQPAAEQSPAHPQARTQDQREAPASTAAADGTPQTPADLPATVASIPPTWLPEVLALMTAATAQSSPTQATSASEPVAAEPQSSLLVEALPAAAQLAAAITPAVEMPPPAAPAHDSPAGASPFASALPSNLTATPETPVDAANLAATQTETAPTATAAPREHIDAFAQTLAAASGQSASASRAPVAQAPIQTALRTAADAPAWSGEVGERLVWMSRQQESRAELILTPPQLGKLEVSLNINGDQASVSFVSANPQVRDTLESALNRLREIFAENGISLGQTHVGSESPSGQNGGQGGRGNQPALAADEQSGVPASAWQPQRNSMVDVFA